jgi:hypothetical protein
MADKQNTAVDREIKPNRNRPIEININGRSFRGPVEVVVGKDDKGKEKIEIVKSKTSVIPAALVAILLSEKNQDRLKKIESKLVPLSTGK